MKQMKMWPLYRYVCYILLGMMSLHACKSNVGDKEASVSDAPASTNEALSSGESDVSASAVWLVNFNDAQAQAIKEQKPILVNFTAGDTCSMCEKLYTDVFSTPVFKEWAGKYLVLLEIDFSKKNQLPPSYEEQHEAMAGSLKVDSYPATWILNITHEPENNRFKVKPMGKIGYQETPEKFIGAIGNLLRFSQKVN
jgi:thioredoxin-related protein